MVHLVKRVLLGNQVIQDLRERGEIQVTKEIKACKERKVHQENLENQDTKVTLDSWAQLAHKGREEYLAHLGHQVLQDRLGQGGILLQRKH